MLCYYPAHFVFDHESAAWQITFRDFPLQQAACYKREDIELEAQESLLTAIAIEMEENRQVPPPSTLQAEEIAIHLPVLVKLKLELHNLMLNTATPKATLARQMGFNGAQIDRLLDIAYASKVEALEQALFLLGYEVHTSVSAIRRQ
ncbi:antitoxin HicB [Chania multitudinisentens RB-25]|uniref:Antitoxin HicB n=1 Tax=Chania multitudinisentens RB-25 TaxID=1441930 RepID=W0LA77_9GAMM|nr:antitoxin HicB [Chania multitudinisentens]AHG18865.1 antitoxin HicB [Chania multitudinisentens RB-25]